MGHEIEWDVFGVRCIYLGQCSYRDVEEALIEVNTSNAYKSLAYCLHDFTQATSLDSGLAVLITVGAHVLGGPSISPNWQTIIITTDDLFASLVKAFSEDAQRPTHVCSSRQEADALALKLFE